MNQPRAVKVLLIDDEANFRDATIKLLLRRGYECVGAGNAREGLDLIGKEKFDVVVLDVKMPGMSGNEAIKEIRKIAADLPVIMLTGHGTPDSVVSGLQDGVFDYLSKPCSIDVLVSRLGDAVQHRKPLAQSERRVADIMIPLSDYSTIHADETVLEAVKSLMNSFRRAGSTGSLVDVGHHSMLVLDDDQEVVGVVSFFSLLSELQAPYMNRLKASLPVQQAIYIEPLSYFGMFTVNARELVRKRVSDIMIDTPPDVKPGDNLMAAVNKMVIHNTLRLLVKEANKTVGVVRQQDLFFELARITEDF